MIGVFFPQKKLEGAKLDNYWKGKKTTPVSYLKSRNILWLKNKNKVDDYSS